MTAAVCLLDDLYAHPVAVRTVGGERRAVARGASAAASGDGRTSADEMIGYMDPVTVVFARDNVRETWSLDLESGPNQEPHFRLTCIAPDGRTWSAEAGDVFECLMRLRREVELVGGRLCCNGARLDAWSSGMQRDMGQGFSCYLLAGVRKGERPPSVKTLDSADPGMVVSVEEQTAWYQRWLQERAE